MSLRYLFGPVTRNFAEQSLGRSRQSGQCLAFDQAGTTDLIVGPQDTWEAVCKRFPAGWQPDFIALSFQYTTISEGLWSAPVPLVGLAMDWNLLWHHGRRALGRCDLVLSDPHGVDLLAREGIKRVRAANLFGCERIFFDEPAEAVDRDIDVLFVANLAPSVQRERLLWLSRLASLADRWRVVIRTGVFGDAYRELLRRSRIVFNRSIRSECNLRVFEALSAGALLFQEDGNRGVPCHLQSGQDYVAYTGTNLEELLEYYLTHEDERQAIAASGPRRAAEGSFENLWDQLIAGLESEIRSLASCVQQRRQPPQSEALITRAWQALSSSQGTDPALIPDLEQALQERPRDAALHNALGLVIALANAAGGRIHSAAANRAAWHFEQAFTADPGHVIAGLNLAEAWISLGRTGDAITAARRALEALERAGELDRAVLDAVHFPPAFDHFRVEWERAAWSHAGDPGAESAVKADLLRWRLRTLLAELTGDLVHYYEAVSARPDLPVTQASLGCALARSGHVQEALPHLRRAVDGNPLDVHAARALYQALRDTQNKRAQEQFAAERRRLAKAVPQCVSTEPWMEEAQTGPSGPAEKETNRGFAIVWEGPQQAIHSFGLLNREICLRLLRRGHDLSLVSHGFQDTDLRDLPGYQALALRLNQPLSRPADIHVRAQWPPLLDPPSSGHWVMFQPWEFGAIPKAWLGSLQNQVDDLWAPSNFVRECFVQAGVPAERVHVIPLGVDEACFHPQAAPLSLRTKRRFKFLFVGGTIYRKGIDLLLEAYAKTFTSDDDVCLVIKDMGVGTFYRGQTAEERIAAHRAQPGAAEIEYLDAKLTAEELAGLYTATDCLVHPYRGEGFGLPIAEAMACGRPVIVTGYGAALDFCNDSNAYLLAASIARFPEKRIGDLETEEYPWLARPDLEALCQALRRVVQRPEEARAKGQIASEHIRRQFTWEKTVDAVEQSLQELSNQRVRRLGTLHRTSTGPQARVSLCMIVKNEEDNLAACLGSVADVVDEMILVDTGSTDGTKEIAARLGARVFDFPWQDSFSAARNESLRHASGDWIFWLDADDRLDDTNREKLRALLRGLRNENAAYSMKCLCLPDSAAGAATVVDHVRLFRNLPEIRWEYRVHEQILPAIRRAGGEVREADVTVQHTGYQDTAWRQAKDLRNLRLLELDHADDPDSPFTLFNLGWTYEEMKRPAEALPLLRRSLELSAPSDSIVRKLYSLIMECHRQLGEPQEALAACLQGRRYYPDDAQLLFQEALLRREQGDRAGAEQCLLRLINGEEAPHFASVVEGLRGHKARHNLAVIYQEQGRFREAEAQWLATVREQPNFTLAWLGLGELYLSLNRYSEAEQALSRLDELQATDFVGAVVLRARLHLARREFAPARRVLEERIGPDSSDPLLWVVLSHVLLQDGTDLDAAERALRRIIELDENNVEARRNLTTLLQQRAAAAEKEASFAEAG